MDNLATCRECLHQELCDTYSRMGVTDVPADDITICELFKSKFEYVKRERGEWKYNFRYSYDARCNCDITCTNCGAMFPRITGVNFKFCPECSADMRKEDNNG